MDEVRIEKWRKDIDQLAECLPERHKNLFYKTQNKAFYNKVDRLKKNLHMFDDIEILVNIAKIVASARDAHTSVIIGRDTFSSALLNAYAIKNKTKAVLVGEPSGGKPNCYGEVESFKLENSKVEICYSSKYYKLIKNDRILSLFPDVERVVTFRDYIEKRDPCLEYILQAAAIRKN